ncbi:MAG TPA: hypothetical protein VFR51_12230 [Pyrinomonadaceae bacterium]|nr:hypothetical protein [Pyrinomonadaceae bacterium]
MKRCPQCEFIYEDDQSLCDMDGVLLVFDSRTLPNHHAVHALATVSGPVPEKGSRRSRMVPAFATLILMLAVASVYFVSTPRSTTTPDFTPPIVNATAASEMPAVVPPAPTPAPEEPPKEEPRETHSSPAPVTTKSAAAPPKNSTKPAAGAKPEPKKDDSKVESILKKTGKLLKKPFKF